MNVRGKDTEREERAFHFNVKEFTEEGERVCVGVCWGVIWQGLCLY